MPDPKENTASIRISQRLLNKLKDEQYEERKSQQPESSYAELLDKAWLCIEQLKTGEMVALDAGLRARMEVISKTSDMPISEVADTAIGHFLKWIDDNRAEGQGIEIRKPEQVPVLEPKSSPDSDEITYYKARMAEAARKAAEAAEILAAAIGGQIDRSADPVTEPDQKTTEEVMRDIKAEFDHTAGRIREHEARIQEAEKQPGASKRAAHRKAPGRGA